MNDPYFHPVRFVKEGRKSKGSILQRCPGCGLGSILFAVLDAQQALGFHPLEFVWLFGSGCLQQLSQMLSPSLTKVDVVNGRLGEALLKALKYHESNPKIKGFIVLMNNLDLLLSGAADWIRISNSKNSLSPGDVSQDKVWVLNENQRKIKGSFCCPDKLESSRAKKSQVKIRGQFQRVGQPEFSETGNDQRSQAFKDRLGNFCRLPVVVLHANNCLLVTNKNGFYPATPLRRPSVDGHHDLPFNLPRLFARLEPCLLARWTPLHGGWLRETLIKSLGLAGISFIEVLIPCVIWDASQQRLLSASERMSFYDREAVFGDGFPLDEFDLRRNKLMIGEIGNSEFFASDQNHSRRPDNLIKNDLLGKIKSARVNQRSKNIKNALLKPLVRIDHTSCRGCGICIELCQAQVLSWGEGRNPLGYHYPLVIDQENCLGCGLCEMFCPEFAIQVERTSGVRFERNE